MSAHKTQSKQAPKAQPYIASLLADIKKDSAKSSPSTSRLSGAQMLPRASSASPSSSYSGASASHRARATSTGSDSASSKTLPQASAVTSEEHRNTTAALPLLTKSHEPAASLEDRAPTRAPVRATPPTTTNASLHKPRGFNSSGPRRSGTEGREHPAEFFRYSSPSEDGECSPPHSKRSPTPAGDFYRPNTYSRSRRDDFQDRYYDYAPRRSAHHSTTGEPQRRKADNYRPRQHSPVRQRHGERIAQDVVQSVTEDLYQLRQRKVNRPKKKFQLDHKGRPLLAKYRKDNTGAQEDPEMPTPGPKAASRRASTQATAKTKKIKTVKDDRDHRRDSGVSTSKSPAEFSVSPTDVKGTGKKSRASSSKKDVPLRTDEASTKSALGKKRAHPTEDLDHDEYTNQASKKTKLSKTEIMQEKKESSSTAADIPQDAATVYTARKKLVPKKPAPSKRKTTAEVVEHDGLTPAPKASRKRKPDEDEDSSSSNSSSEDGTPLAQLRPAKKQKEEQVAVKEDVSTSSEISSPNEAADIASKGKATRKATTGKKQQTGVPAEQTVKGVAYIKLDDGTYMKQERQRKVGTTKSKAKPKATNFSRLIKG